MTLILKMLNLVRGRGLVDHDLWLIRALLHKPITLSYWHRIHHRWRLEDLLLVVLWEMLRLCMSAELVRREVLLLLLLSLRGLLRDVCAWRYVVSIVIHPV